MKFLFLLVLLITLPAFAENLCVAPYGLQNKSFKYTEYKESLQGVNAYNFSFLWNSFGTYNEYLSAELRSPQTKGVIAILINENCAKKQYGPRGRCGPYEVLHRINSNQFRNKVSKNDPVIKGKIQAQAKSMCSFINANIPLGKTRALSPLLETELPAKEFNKVATWVHEVSACEDYIIVYNPMGSSPGLPVSPATVSEGHGPNPKFSNLKCIANLDGSLPDDGDFADYAVRYSACEFGGCLWVKEFNLLNRGAKWVHPRARRQTDISDFKLIGKALKTAQEALKPTLSWSTEDTASLFGCDKTFGSTTANPFSDGAGSLIYKDSHIKGSSAHKGTILFPARFGKLTHVEIWKEGKKFLEVKYAPGKGFPDQNANNKLRPIYRFDRHLNEMPFNIVIKADDNKGQKICYIIRNSKTRND